MINNLLIIINQRCRDQVQIKRKFFYTQQISRIKQLIYAYKGAQVCNRERADFALCRATPAGRLGDPEMCEGRVASFL